MNVNLDKVKELVLLFSELDDEYQNKLMRQAFVLSLKQSQKNQIKKENKKFSNVSDLENEIEKRSRQGVKEIINMVEIYDKVGDKEKAELIVLLDRLSHGNLTKKTNIEIKINEERVPLKDYLEEILPNSDFREANKNVEKYLKEIRKE